MTATTQTKCKDIFEKSCSVIPGGVSSPVRAFPNLKVDPIVAEKGAGDLIWDADGDSYIDYCMSWGALLCGHAHPDVVASVTERIAEGSSFGLATEVEEKLARHMVNTVPSIEKVRFVSSGTEATMTAVRLARGFTNRPLIVKFNGNYHGHSDPFLVNAGSAVAHLSRTSSSAGVPTGTIQNTLSIPYNDVEAVQDLMAKYGSEVAAIIVEPIAANMGVVPASEQFLLALRQLTTQHGSLLIFDEVISGFRVGLTGAQGVYGIGPDLTTYGKIVGGGFPAAALGGRADVMDYLAPTGPVFQAGTLSGNPVAMQAGLTTLEMAQSPRFYDDLRAKVEMITAPVRKAIAEKGITACIQEVGGMFTLFWGVTEVTSFEDLKDIDHDRFEDFFTYMLDHGVYMAPSPYEACFVSSAHTNDHLIHTRDLILRYV